MVDVEEPKFERPPSAEGSTPGRKPNKDRRRKWHKRSKEDSGPSNEATERKKGGKKPAKPPLTHFLCIPLVTESSRPQLAVSLRQFRQDVLGGQKSSPPEATELRSRGAEVDASGLAGLSPGEKTPGSAERMVEAKEELPQIPEKAIRPLGTLHLTLGVMSLMDQDRIDGAVNLLKGLDVKAMLKEAVTQEEATSSIPKANMEALSSDNGTVMGATTLLPSTEAAEGEAAQRGDDGENFFTSNTSVPSSPSASSHQSPSSAEPSLSLVQPPIVPLYVSLKSLNSMHTPKKTSILYSSPHDPSGRLYPFCNNLRTAFQKTGFLLPDDRPLKLHATVVNTIYAKRGGRRGKADGKRAVVKARTVEPQPADPSSQVPEASETNNEDTSVTLTAPLSPPTTTDPPAEEQEADASAGHGPNAKALLRFDATTLLARYKDFAWASDVRVERIAICKMGAKKILDKGGELVDEEYEVVASVNVA